MRLTLSLLLVVLCTPLEIGTNTRFSGEAVKKRASEHEVITGWYGKTWIARKVAVVRVDISKFIESFDENNSDVSTDAAVPVEYRQIKHEATVMSELQQENVEKVRYDLPRDVPQFHRAADKQDCSEYYPLPQGYENWTNCKPNGGGSGCGGPDQCACDDSQRLVTFTCDQGIYHQCWAEKGNGCPGE